MKKKILYLLVVAVLLAMSPIMTFASGGNGNENDNDNVPGTWESYKSHYRALESVYEKVNPKHQEYSDLAAELIMLRAEIETLFGVSFSENPDENEGGLGGLIGAAAAAEFELTQTDKDASGYPLTSRDFYDVYISTYNKLYVTSVDGITIAPNHATGAKEGLAELWQSIKTLWNAPEMSKITGGGLDTPEQAVIDAAATRVIFEEYGDCTNNNYLHRYDVFGNPQFSLHSLGIGCTFDKRPINVPTDRAQLLNSTGVTDVAKNYVAAKAEYEEVFGNILAKSVPDSVKVVVLSVNDDEKLIADSFISAKETDAARYRDVTDAGGVTTFGLISAARTNLSDKIVTLKDRIETATSVTFTEDLEDPVIDKPIIDNPVVDKPVIDTRIIDKPIIGAPAVGSPAIDEPAVDAPVNPVNPGNPGIENPAIDEAKTSDSAAKIPGVDKNSNPGVNAATPLPAVGFVPGDIITEVQGSNIPDGQVPGTSPIEMEALEYSSLWYWGLIADIAAFAVVCVIVLWRRRQRLNAGEEFF
jgi:hypothetical protein